MAPLRQGGRHRNFTEKQKEKKKVLNTKKVRKNVKESQKYRKRKRVIESGRSDNMKKSKKEKKTNIIIHIVPLGKEQQLFYKEK